MDQIVCEQAYETLKQALVVTPILKAHKYWEKVFHVHIDASGYAIGCILIQSYEKNIYRSSYDSSYAIGCILIQPYDEQNMDSHLLCQLIGKQYREELHKY